MSTIKIPKIQEMCKDEIQDFIIELIQRQLQTIPDNMQSRRKELCIALLCANQETGSRAKLRAEICSIVKDWQGQNEKVDALRHLGFSVTKGRKHSKLRWNDSEYYKTLSSSPSDWRTGANAIAEVTAIFF